MFKVGSTEFKTFDEVVAWAWNMHKIDYSHDPIHVAPLDIEDQHEACKDLELMIAGG